MGGSVIRPRPLRTPLCVGEYVGVCVSVVPGPQSVPHDPHRDWYSGTVSRSHTEAWVRLRVKKAGLLLESCLDAAPSSSGGPVPLDLLSAETQRK